MQPGLNSDLRKLEELAGSHAYFEAVVLVRKRNRICEAGAIKTQNMIKAYLADGSAGRAEYTETMADAFRKTVAYCDGYEVLVDTATLRTAAVGSAYESSDSPLLRLTVSAWEEALCGKGSSAHLSPRAQEIGASLIRLLGVWQAAQLQGNNPESWKFYTSVWLKDGDDLRLAELTMSFAASQAVKGYFHIFYRNSPYTYEYRSFRSSDDQAAMITLAHLLKGTKVILETLVVCKGFVGDELVDSKDEIYRTLRAFWSACTNEEEPERQVECLNPLEVREALLRDTLFSCLREGAADRWSNLATEDKKRCVFDRSDLAGKKIKSLKLNELHFPQSKFDGAVLQKFEAKGTWMENSTFRGADLSGANLTGAILDNVDFSGAKLCKVKFNKAHLRGARFHDADLDGADFTDTLIECAEFDNCKGADTAKFLRASYDMCTRLPTSFNRQAELRWVGEEADPYLLSLMSSPETMTFETFLHVLQQDFDKAKVSKALSMLKTERFQLYSRNDEHGVVGVVRSQTDQELVYACKLGAEGSFSCCTQNLNPCGGLKGGLCKHILVLSIGLAREGAVQPGDLALRISSSKMQKPKLIKDHAASVFLQYTAATTGELDWRPTETTPEDYYAF